MNPYRQVHNLSLIVQPGDSFFPIVDAIDSATREIKMTIFRMDDPVVREALNYAVNRKVRVQALIAPTSKGWSKRNKRLGDELTKLGVEVRVPKPGKEKIKKYHYKFLTVDDAEALILTFNPTQKNLHYARDFGLLVKDREITTELNRLFDADWSGQSFTPSELPLVISPFNSRKKLLELLSTAERSIRIMDAKIKDHQVTSLLLRKAAAGCSVRIISRDTHYDDIVPNLHVCRLGRYKLHAKCIVIDSTYFFVGSQNLRKVSLDDRRELGIIVEDTALARRIERVFDEDWIGATEIRGAANEANVGGLGARG
jgi:phosphatidylserine/phosphatidylglycerophosphate/cardiolipin synthase-like enzyme